MADSGAALLVADQSLMEMARSRCTKVCGHSLKAEQCIDISLSYAVQQCLSLPLVWRLAAAQLTPATPALERWLVVAPQCGSR